MRELIGIPASPGIFIGPAFLFIEEEVKEHQIPCYAIQDSQRGSELARFEAAREKTEAELTVLRDRANAEMGQEHAAIFDSHILMLNDIELAEQIETLLKKDLQNIEWVLYTVEQNLIKKMAGNADEYLAERVADVKDVSRRLMSHLMKRERASLGSIREECALVARNLLPSDTMAINRQLVKGIALDSGGKTSHTSIIARAFKIPAVLGLQEITNTVKTGDRLIIDGNTGKVILDPDAATLARYRELREKQLAHERELESLSKLEACTTDGKRVFLKANIAIPEEAEIALGEGVDGIGLYRSEFLYLDNATPPSEDRQFKAYRSVLETMGKLPVTIRTLDLGGDKMTEELEAEGEKNPLLGWRAIRFCLTRQDVFRTQLRALLRASVYGNLKVMFPMISGSRELTQAMEIVGTVKRELEVEGIPFSQDIAFGTMIEIPSAALTTDILAKQAAFFSIGTNDLTQYTVAVDRGNERIAYLYAPFHPAVLRLIKLTVDNAHKAGISVSMCGELAGDPSATALLVGLGLDELSMSPGSILEVKRFIRGVSLAEARALAEEIMEKQTAEEIDAALKAWKRQRFASAEA
jgi:phosphotransferase system enzyme I (PtsI)